MELADSILELDRSIAVVLAITIASLLIIDLRRGAIRAVTGRNVALATIAFWYLLEALVLSREVRLYNQAAYNWAIALVALGTAAFLTGYYLMPGNLFRDFGSRLERLEEPKTTSRILFIGMAIGFFPLLIIARFDVWEVFSSAFQFGKRWSGSFTRGRYGGIQDAFLELTMFLKASIPLAVIVAFNKKQTTTLRCVATAFIIWMFMSALTTWTRSALLPVILPVCAAAFFLTPDRRRSTLLYFGVPLLTLVGLWWSAWSVENRGKREMTLSTNIEAEYVGYEMFQEMMFLANTVPEYYDFELGSTYFAQIVNPIPRFLWPSKPSSDAGLKLAVLRNEIDVNTGEAYLTRSPGVFGEMYWNFGIPGLLCISFVYGWIVRSWDVIWQDGEKTLVRFVIFSAGLAVIFLTGRSFAMPIYYGMISFYALLVILGRGRTASPGRTKPSDSAGITHRGGLPQAATNTSSLFQRR